MIKCFDLWKSHRKTCGARLLSITYMNIKMLTSFSSPSKKGPGQHVNWHARRPQEPFPQVNTVKCSEHAGEGAGRVVKPAKASHAVQYWSEAFWQCHKGKWGCFKVRNFLNWKQIIPPYSDYVFPPLTPPISSELPYSSKSIFSLIRIQKSS